MTLKESIQSDTSEGISNLEQINTLKPSQDLIRQLREQRRIQDCAPLWWDTDYAPNPREYVPFESFKKRLVGMGVCTISRSSHFRSEPRLGDETYQADVRLYTSPTVPMTILPLEIDGLTLPFFITARPYHQREQSSYNTAHFVYRPISELRQHLRDGNPLLLPRHFFPHIRGLFAGARGNHLFWYPFNVDYDTNYHKLISALAKGNNTFLDINSPAADRTYEDARQELAERNLIDARAPHWFDFLIKQVSAEDLIETAKGEHPAYTYYPVRVPGVEHTLPVVVSNKTHSTSEINRLAAIGVYAVVRGGGDKRGGIWRIKDRELASNVSAELTSDFGVPVDAVLFTPQKGRPHFERVTA